MGGFEISSREGTTQGDPTAMHVYALGIGPLLILLSRPLDTGIENKVRQSAFADDLAGGGTIDQLKLWWDLIVAVGSMIGYTAKPSKSWLIVKLEHREYAEQVFAGTGIQITSDGQRHLGAVVGSAHFRDEYVNKAIDEWIEELKVLSTIAKVEPQLAYAAYIFGFQHRNIINRSPTYKDLSREIAQNVTVSKAPHSQNG